MICISLGVGYAPWKYAGGNNEAKSELRGFSCPGYLKYFSIPDSAHLILSHPTSTKNGSISNSTYLISSRLDSKSQKRTIKL